MASKRIDVKINILHTYVVRVAVEYVFIGRPTTIFSVCQDNNGCMYNFCDPRTCGNCLKIHVKNVHIPILILGSDSDPKFLHKHYNSVRVCFSELNIVF